MIPAIKLSGHEKCVGSWWELFASYVIEEKNWDE